MPTPMCKQGNLRRRRRRRHILCGCFSRILSPRAGLSSSRVETERGRREREVVRFLKVEREVDFFFFTFDRSTLSKKPQTSQKPKSLRLFWHASRPSRRYKKHERAFQAMQAHALRTGASNGLCAVDSMPRGWKGRAAQGGGNVSCIISFYNGLIEIALPFFFFFDLSSPHLCSLALSNSLSPSPSLHLSAFPLRAPMPNGNTHMHQKRQLLRPALHGRWPPHLGGHQRLPWRSGISVYARYLERRPG